MGSVRKNPNPRASGISEPSRKLVQLFHQRLAPTVESLAFLLCNFFSGSDAQAQVESERDSEGRLGIFDGLYTLFRL